MQLVLYKINTMKRLGWICWLMLMQCNIFGQATVGSISGKVVFNQQAIAGAVLVLVNEATGQQLSNVSNTYGIYGFYQLQPGSSYHLTVHYPLADTVRIQHLTIQVGEDILLNIPLQSSVNLLSPVLVNSTLQSTRKGFQRNLLDNKWIRGNGLGQLLLHQPNALVKNDQSGAVSFGGQNYKYNGYYIDGVLQNDQFGLSPTGTLMGELGILSAAPESFEQMVLSTSAYDASLGNFTGATIHMVTKAGKNKPSQEIYATSQLNGHQYWHSGVNISGPIVYKKLLYFLNIDQVNTQIERPFDLRTYQGNTNQIKQIERFRQSVQSQFGYDPGNIDQMDNSKAQKLSLRLDAWLSAKSQMIINLKMTQGISERNLPSQETILQFSNNAKRQWQNLLSFSVALKKNINTNTQNLLSLFISHHQSHTQPISQPFPTFRLLDGEGFFVFGANEDSYLNHLKQTNINVLNRWSKLSGQHFVELGFDIDANWFKNHFLQNGHGQYFYYSIKDFLQNRPPIEFNINEPASSMNPLSPLSNMVIVKSALFFNYKTSISKSLFLQAGLRLNAEKNLSQSMPDSFTQSTAIPILSNHYPLHGTQSGQFPRLMSMPSPRLLLKWVKPNTTVQLGLGLFTGRIPYAWLAGIQSNNGQHIVHRFANKDALKAFAFSSNWSMGQLNTPANTNTNKGIVSLAAEKIQLPNLIKSTLDIHQTIGSSLQVNLQGHFFSNLSALQFVNINIDPSQTLLESVDQRPIKNPHQPLHIPMLLNGNNPYDAIILLQNQPNQKGYGYGIGLEVLQKSPNEQTSIRYHFEQAYSMFDGHYSIPINHWRLNEQVLGRNQPQLSQSDYSLGHSIQFEYRLQLKSTLKNRLQLSVHYNGQSGTPYSFVYGNKNLSGDDPTSIGYDLIYIPLANEIQQMVFKPIIKNNLYYTTDQQKEALEWFIRSHDYLKNRRGQYAERNGARTPFIHRIDLELFYQFIIKIPPQQLRASITLGVLNIGHLLNQHWGQPMVVQGNRDRLLAFEGFSNNQSFIPVFSFDPTRLNQSIYKPINSTNPSRTGNWMLQLGFRLSFY